MQSHSGWLDDIMHWVSGKLTWIPLYALIIYMLFKQTDRPFTLLICLLLSVGCADFIASGLAKPYFERLRPCHNTSINELLDLTHCGGQYGYFSSHASISFTIAGFVFLLSKKWGGIMIIWASVVAYSRVYLCVHYPSDIITGAISGILLSYLWYSISIPLANFIKK